MGTAAPTRVLIAGASGFIGSHLVEHLSQAPGREVVAIDLDVLDLSAPGAAEALPEQIDYCYHFAGTMPTWKFYQHPDIVLSNDLKVTLNLAEWASEGNCKKIIYASSNEVYLDADADEDALPRPAVLPVPPGAVRLEARANGRADALDAVLECALGEKFFDAPLAAKGFRHWGRFEEPSRLAAHVPHPFGGVLQVRRRRVSNRGAVGEYRRRLVPGQK